MWVCHTKGKLRPSGGNSYQISSMFDPFMDMGGITQGAATNIRGEHLQYFTKFDAFMDVGVTPQGEAMGLRGKYFAILKLCLVH